MLGARAPTPCTPRMPPRAGCTAGHSALPPRRPLPTWSRPAAPQLAAWARATPWVRWTAFWSIGRDKYNGEKYVSIHSSSIPQQPFDFTRAFQAVAQ